MTDAAESAKRGRWNPVPQPISTTVCPRQSWIERIDASITPSGSTPRFSAS
jgi:hypothetical protein